MRPIMRHLHGRTARSRRRRKPALYPIVHDHLLLVQANTKARQVIANTWHGELESQLGLKESGGSGGSGSNSGKDLAAGAGADADRVSVTLPLLAEEAWVTEDELARLFLVTSEMSTVLNVSVYCAD